VLAVGVALGESGGFFKMDVSDDMGEWDRLGRQSGGDARWVFGHHNPTHRSNAIAREYETIDILIPSHPADFRPNGSTSEAQTHLEMFTSHSAQSTASASLRGSFPQRCGMEERHPKNDGISALAVSEGCI